MPTARDDMKKIFKKKYPKKIKVLEISDKYIKPKPKPKPKKLLRRSAVNPINNISDLLKATLRIL